MLKLGPKPETAITPNRRTIVTIDGNDVTGVERPIFIEKVFEAIADPSQNAQRTTTASGTLTDPGYNVQFQKEHGWTLSTQLESSEIGTESDQFPGSEVSFTVAPGILSRPSYRANDDLPGITLGATQVASGGNYYQKEVAAGDSFVSELTADAAAYPGSPDNSVQPLKRIAVSTANAKPTDQISYSLQIFDRSIGSNFDSLARVYFVGPAGHQPDDGTKIGTGQYELTLGGGGKAYLKERLQDGESYSWVLRDHFSWGSRGRMALGLHEVLIYTDSVELADGTFQGSKIMFQFTDAGGGSNFTMMVESRIQAGIQALSPSGPNHVFKVSDPTRYQPQLTKFRISDRVDVRSKWQLHKAIYFRNGELRTNTVDLGRPPSANKPLYIEWFGNRPSGTTVTIRAFDAETGTELTASGAEQSYTDYGFKGFDPTSGRTSDTGERKYSRRQYYAVIKFQSADGSKRPVLRRLRWNREQVTGRNTTSPTSAGVIQSISITGQDNDPTHETALIRIADVKGDLTRLQIRAQMPIKVEIAYDPADDTKRCTLFSGYVAQAKRTVRGAKDKPVGLSGEEISVYPVNNWATYELRCTGEWQRLYEAKTDQAYNFTVDAKVESTVANPATPWKISDIVRKLILSGGYEEDNVLIKDYDLRLFTSGDTKELLVIEPLTEIFPLASAFVTQYLGGWIYWDANASGSETPYKMGAWRLSTPVRPVEGEFPVLAHFKNTPDVNEGKVRYSVNAQNVETGLNDQPIKTVWVRKGSLHSYVVPPEANEIIITGAGDVPGPGLLSKTSTSNITQVIRNYKSAKFFEGQPIEPDPSSPDFLGRPVTFYRSDPSLTTAKAVNFVTRRIYDQIAHAQKRITFEAPLLLVTDVTDTYQRQPRPLRFGDVVKYEGQIFIVQNCNPDYSGGGSGRKMMATYELFSPLNEGTSAGWTPKGVD